MDMLDMLDMLRRSGGLDAMAGQLGITPAEAAAGAGALLPAVVGGFKKRSQADGAGEAGIGGLIGMLGGLGGGALADNVVGPDPTDVGRGNEVLGQIFGSKEVSRTVAGHASQQSGLDPALLRRMLPILAMLVGGFLSSRGGGGAAGAPAQGGSGTGGGIFGNILGSVLGGGAGAQGGGGLGGIGAMLDLDGDGNPLDDIVGMAGRLGR